MKTRFFFVAALPFYLLLIATPELHAQTPLPNFDVRSSAVPAAAAPEKSAALEILRQSVPSVKVEFEPVSGAPKMVASTDGFLTGPEGRGKTISASNLASFATTDPHHVTKSFLQEHRALFGHGPEALATARVRRDDLTAHNGMHTMVWEQQVDGIAVFEGRLISHTTGKGELISISSQFISDPDAAAMQGTPDRASLVATPIVSARQAVALAARDVGEAVAAETLTQTAGGADAERKQTFSASVLKGDAQAKLVWLPMDKNSMRLCWDVELMSKKRGEMFRTLVDVRTGDVLLRRCLTSYISNASYRVWTSDSPSPFSPGWITPTNLQPPIVARTLVTLSAMDTNASPSGWIPDGGNETVGNNVDAHTDWNNDDLPDLPRPQGSPTRVFDFSIDLAAQDPTNYSAAAVVQLFYLCNWYHDKLYALGFTESAGNFQSNNFGRGGVGNDAVQADAQDGSGLNNADFSTPSDGSPGRMQMYIFSTPTPRRDGDFDAEVVFHEATHGLSGRLVGGGLALNTVQSGGMGEGWSDFYALALLSEPGDSVNGNFAMGGYDTYLLAGGTQNYYYGIRRYPYSTDLTKNPLTFKDIDPAQASSHSGVPRGPIGSATANEVHNEGEVWCVTLNEARVGLINKFGWATGNQLMLQLATDGMKLTVPEPNFLQARDAILQADLVDNGGANSNVLWAAFAKRGMGLSATSPASSTTTGLHEAFDVPNDLRLSPATGFTSSGGINGPFSVPSQNYVLTNIGAATLNWTLASTSAWLNVSSSSGALTVGGSTTVNFSLNTVASNLTAGTYTATAQFTNNTSGVALEPLTFSLNVLGAPAITAQPTNQTVFAGATATFSAGVIGLPVLNYQWRLNAANLLNATNLTLVLTSVTAGQVGNYSLFVSNNFGAITSSIAVLRVLTNDACSGATVITANSFTASETTANATSTGDPVPNCVSGLFGKGVWFVFTPFGTGPAAIDTLGSSFDTVLGIYTGGCGAQTQAQCDDDSGGGVLSKITFTATNGTAYYILAGGWNGATGNLQLNLNFTPTQTPPTITAQPNGQTVPIGGTANFSVAANGTAPLGYFWRRNGALIVGANASTYSTNNVRLVDSGAQFSCLVSNPVSSVISSNATLVVDPTLVVALTNVTLNAAHLLQFRVTGQLGDIYRVQTTTNLLGGWQTLASLTNLSGSILFTDGTTTNLGSRFYRCVMP